MINHPALVLAVAERQHEELIEDAARHRLAANLRRSSRQHWPDEDSNKARANHRPAHAR